MSRKNRTNVCHTATIGAINATALRLIDERIGVPVEYIGDGCQKDDLVETIAEVRGILDMASAMRKAHLIAGMPPKRVKPGG